MTDSPRIEDIATARGYEIIEYLVAEGWQVVLDYSGFDKGIDHDWYILQKADAKLDFFWDNWTEWTITGDRGAIALVSTLFGL